MELAIIIAAVWVVCGFIAYGVAVHSLQQVTSEFPDLAAKMLPSDRAAGMVMFIAGPAGLLAVLSNARRPLGFKL